MRKLKLGLDLMTMISEGKLLARGQVGKPSGSISTVVEPQTDIPQGESESQDVITITGNTGGTDTVPYIRDTTPPGIPTGIEVSSIPDGAVLTWDGTLEDGVPADFAGIQIAVDNKIVDSSLKVAGSVPLSLAAGAHNIKARSYDNAHDINLQPAPNYSAWTSNLTVTVGAAVQGVVTEYALGDSADVAPTEGWSSDSPVWTKGKYIWSRTVTTTSSGVEVGDPVCIQGAQGQDGTPGRDGAAGKDGKGIKSAVVSYQAGASGTIAPTGTWLEKPPAVSPGQYLWTRTVTTYTDNQATTMYSVGKMGEQGAPGKQGKDGTSGKDGKGIKSAVVAYQSGTSGTVAPTGTWLDKPPVVKPGEYLWTRTVTTYTDGASTTMYAVGKMGEQGKDGRDGDDGLGIKSVVAQYYLSTSSSTQAGGSWSTTPATWVSGRYYWTRSQVTWDDNTTTYTTPVLDKATTAANQAASDAKDNSQSVYRIVSNTGSIERTPAGEISPSTLNVAAYHPVAGKQAIYAGRWKIERSIDQTTWTALYTSTADEASKAVSIAGIGDARFVRISLYAAGGTTTLLNQATVGVVEATGNFLVHNENGLYVVQTEGDPNTGGALRLASDAIEMLRDGTALMRVGASAIELGVNREMSSVSLCGGACEIEADEGETRDVVRINTGFGDMELSGYNLTLTADHLDISAALDISFIGGRGTNLNPAALSDGMYRLTRSMTLLWSGTMTVGSTASVSGISDCNMVAVTERVGAVEQDILLVGAVTPNRRKLHCSAQNDDGSSSYLHKASFNLSGDSVTLEGASRHRLAPNVDGVVTSVAKIYALL